MNPMNPAILEITQIKRPTIATGIKAKKRGTITSARKPRTTRTIIPMKPSTMKLNIRGAVLSGYYINTFLEKTSYNHVFRKNLI